MSHKNDKVQNVSMVSQILTSVKDSLLSRECYLHEHQGIIFNQFNHFSSISISGIGLSKEMI